MDKGGKEGGRRVLRLERNEKRRGETGEGEGEGWEWRNMRKHMHLKKRLL